MKLRMREAESSIKLNRIQQADRISLKQKLLKIGHFRVRPESALGAGALPSCASLDSITCKTEVVELCGTLGNTCLQFYLQLPVSHGLAIPYGIDYLWGYRSSPLCRAPAIRAGVRQGVFKLTSGLYVCGISRSLSSRLRSLFQSRHATSPESLCNIRDIQI